MTWLKTRAELNADVFYALRDTEKAFISDTMVNLWLNQAYLDLCARLRIPEATATGTSSSVGVIPLPTDIVEPKNLIVDDQRMTWVPHDTWLAYDVPDVTPTVPIFRIFGSNIQTLPTAVSEAYSLEYVKQPTEMTADGSFPSELQPEMLKKLVMYARAEAKVIEGELEEADRYKAEYERGLPDVPRMTYKRVAGPPDLWVGAGPFETYDMDRWG